MSSTQVAEKDASAAAPQMVNGVDVGRLFDTVAAVKQTPALAKFSFRAEHRWLGGAHNRTTVGDFYGACQTHPRSAPFVIDKDEHPALLGEDRGPNPVEYVLAALAGCLTTSLVYHAAAQGIEIEAVEATLEGDCDLRGFLGLDESVRNGYEGVRVSYKIKAEASAEKLRELVELAQRRSPVFDIVSNPVPVSVRAEKA